VKVLDTALRLLHPFMPFVTEEIWQKLPRAKGQLMTSAFPTFDSVLVNMPIEAEVAEVMETVRVIRNLRASALISPAKKVTLRIISAGSKAPLIERHAAMIQTLAGAEKIELVPSKPAGHLVGLHQDTEICLNLAGLIDAPVEITRISAELAKIEKERLKISAKLEDQGFVSKAPAEVVDKIRDGITAYDVQREKLSAYLEELRKL